MMLNGPARFLAEELERRIKKNSSYSMRSFAHYLKLSPGELSEIIRGKRRLSLKGALKILKALSLSPSEVESFLKMIQESEALHSGVVLPGVSTGERLRKKQLSEDLFFLVSDWCCFAILSLADTRGFRFDIGLIGKRLGISVTEAKLAVDRLERVGLIHRNEGKLQVSSDYVMSPDEISSEAVRNCHEQILDKAKTALHEQGIGEREIGGITFAVNPKRIPELKKDLKKFLDSWANKVSLLDPKNKTEVYHLESILFRLSNKGDAS